MACLRAPLPVILISTAIRFWFSVSTPNISNGSPYPANTLRGIHAKRFSFWRTSYSVARPTMWSRKPPRLKMSSVGTARTPYSFYQPFVPFHVHPGHFNADKPVFGN